MKRPLKQIKEIKNQLKGLGIRSFIDEECLIVSAEDGSIHIDYYGEFQEGTPYVSDKVQSLIGKPGQNWEWASPGSLIVY